MACLYFKNRDIRDAYQSEVELGHTYGFDDVSGRSSNIFHVSNGMVPPGGLYDRIGGIRDPNSLMSSVIPKK